MELPALQDTAEQGKGPHVPAHPCPPFRALADPTSVPAQPQALGSVLFPFHVLAGLVFHGVTAPVSLLPHEMLLISALVVGVLPTDPSCTPASAQVHLALNLMRLRPTNILMQGK